MNLFTELCIGSFMIGLTVMIQAVSLDLVMKRVGRLENFLRFLIRPLWQAALSAIIVTYIFIIHVINIWLWLGLYMILDCLPTHDLSALLNFSTTTYTTVGDNILALRPGFSMFTGIEAANGLILMGWSTAFIFELITQIYRKEAKALRD